MKVLKKSEKFKSNATVCACCDCASGDADSCGFGE